MEEEYEHPPSAGQDQIATTSIMGASASLTRRDAGHARGCQPFYVKYLTQSSHPFPETDVSSTLSLYMKKILGKCIVFLKPYILVDIWIWIVFRLQACTLQPLSPLSGKQVHSDSQGPLNFLFFFPHLYCLPCG